MNVSLPKSGPADPGLRSKAEQRLREMPRPGLPPLDWQTTVDELHVYEAELEIQNEELIASRAEIEASQRKYFRHFDLAPVGLIRLDHKGIILEANILGAQMLGVNRALLQSTTRSFLAHVLKDSVGLFQQHLESALISGKMEMCELSLRSSTGVETFIRMQSVVNRSDGDAMDLYTTLTDLTERRDIEHRLEIEGRRAEAAVASKELFFAMLSHELRTPLTPILALVSELAAEAQRSVGDRATFAIIRRNLSLEIQLIDDLLDLTRITICKLELQCGPCDLHASLSNAVEICREDVIAKGLKLSCQFMETPHFISGDSGRLLQLFWNLIKNAVKFTPAPSTITIETRFHTPTQVLVEFRDTGIGIDVDALNHIFDPFYQAAPIIKERLGGLGLGLAICRAIAEAHGGTLSATSAGVGFGTTFRVVLPVIPTPAHLPTPALQTIPPKPPRRHFKLLLLEDHLDTRVVLARLLRRRGYKVVEARDLAEADAICCHERFDLLLTDIGLPEASGYDVLKALNEKYGLLGIAMTGYGTNADLAKGREAGFLDYLVKPISADDLDEAIQRVSVKLPG
ncbi:MAG: sensor hybrid histidine kinase [Verrucomicrobiaceae bacterium]|nr:sensor hybrid histidine kinase [Verrucomicrobiaceae bacterium]